MTQCGKSMDTLRECPRERITRLDINNEEMRAKALEAARWPDADVSMPAVLLLMLLERQHATLQRAVKAERSRDFAEKSMRDMSRSTREMADKWEAQGERYLCAIAAVQAADQVIVSRIGKRIGRGDFDRYRAALASASEMVERLTQERTKA